jgi:hypothetical protein
MTNSELQTEIKRQLGGIDLEGPIDTYALRYMLYNIEAIKQEIEND